MAVKTSPRAGQRHRLSRHGILETALRYIDMHGLEALSMHKLGAELGVKGMSLYNHVASKDEVLDGVVELLWSEIEATADVTDDWHEGLRSFAHALRHVILRHPNAAPLITSQQIMPEPALSIVQAYTAVAEHNGVTEPEAHALLRTITSYAVGSSVVEQRWIIGTMANASAVSDLLRPGIPDDLAAVAENFCGKCDMDAQFELGLNLMLRGLNQSSP